MHCVFELLIKKSFRTGWVPVMYCSLLAAFWVTKELFKGKFSARILLLGATKMLVGRCEAGWDMLK